MNPCALIVALRRYTLRYTGGMVPDVYHILIKNKGVFTNVSSKNAKAKLRLVYECAPIALVVEAAGGARCVCECHLAMRSLPLRDEVKTEYRKVQVATLECFGLPGLPGFDFTRSRRGRHECVRHARAVAAGHSRLLPVS